MPQTASHKPYTQKMAYYLSQILLIPLLLSTLFWYTNAQTETNPSLNTAIQDMQNARYFTFLMLVKMVANKVPANMTFLMPSDRMLSAAVIPENQVLNFIFLHSIPAAMLYKDLINLPNGTILPSSEPNYLFRAIQRDNQKLFLNNAELVGPDICNNETPFRCHGISTVIRWPVHKKAPAGSTCQSPPIGAPPLNPVALPPAPMPSMPPTSMNSPAPSPDTAIDSGPQNSASSDIKLRGFFVYFIDILIISITSLQLKFNYYSSITRHKQLKVTCTVKMIFFPLFSEPLKDKPSERVLKREWDN
ncbi:hypothetical protein LUZ61_020091 [Rhynchospora tenuis]|uniref:FAS1 domain-containing protein n=1 Tax=Rhynchospora tenuis TaxID=198213 RepID=A0AAD5ZCJ7_9POAL|nr:hypothetical protein LUZ61_020091 [Rhynchospora tenuis]